jgi:hypothetical protein
MTRIVLVILSLSLMTCTYLPTLPSRNDAPQQIKPPVPKLP